MRQEVDKTTYGGFVNVDLEDGKLSLRTLVGFLISLEVLTMIIEFLINMEWLWNFRLIIQLLRALVGVEGHVLQLVFTQQWLFRRRLDCMHSTRGLSRWQSPSSKFGPWINPWWIEKGTQLTENKNATNLVLWIKKLTFSLHYLTKFVEFLN